MYGRVTLSPTQEKFVTWATSYLVSDHTVKWLGDRQYWIREQFFQDMEQHEDCLSNIAQFTLMSLHQQLSGR